MPLKTGTDRSRDDGEETRALAGKKLSPWLLKLMGDRALPLPSRLRMQVTMPPLASYIWQQVGHLVGQGNRLTRWVTDHVGLTSLQMARLPTLKPVAPSPVWQRLLDLTWFRRHQKGRRELSQTLNVTDEEWQLINVANEPHPNEFPETLRLTDEKRPLSTADRLYPMVIENLLLPPVARGEPPDTTYDFFHPTYVSSAPLPAKLVTNEPKTRGTRESITPYISQSKIPSLYQADKIQGPDHPQVKAWANWQPQPTYQSRWSAGVLTPLTQKSVLHRMPITRSHHITSQNIPWAQVIPVRHRPYLTTAEERVEPSRQAVQQPTLPYLGNTANIAEVTTMDDEVIQNLENYNWPVSLETETNLPYSLPDQNKPTMSRTVLKRFGPPTMLKTTSSFRELPFNLPTLYKEPVLGLLPTKITPQQTPETSQAGWSMPLASPLPQIVGPRAEATFFLEGSASMMHRPIAVPVSLPDNVSLSQEQPTSPTEPPSIHRKHPPAVSLRRQSQPITESIDRTPVTPWQQYFKSVGSAPSPDRSESYSFLRNKGNEPSYSQYKDSRQPALELLLTSIAGPKASFNTTSRREPLPATFEGAAHYGSQPTPELALAPVGRTAETASTPSPRTEMETKSTTGEASAPDIDTIARDVYSLLKRRLARERERALGLS